MTNHQDSSVVKVLPNGDVVLTTTIDSGDTLLTREVQNSAGAPKAPERPKDSDSKSVWFEYAVAKGHVGEYDDITKAQLIASYGG